MSNQPPELDPLIHQPIRTKIMTYLANVGEADYTLIKKILHLHDGHMSTHMKKLSEADYVRVKKEFINNKPCTTYRLSTRGKQQYKRYINSIKRIINS